VAIAPYADPERGIDLLLPARRPSPLRDDRRDGVEEQALMLPDGERQVARRKRVGGRDRAQVRIVDKKRNKPEQDANRNVATQRVGSDSRSFLAAPVGSQRRRRVAGP
jgi:hypothetical protein